LEYGLLNNKIKDKYIKIPVTILFPVMLAYTDVDNSDKVLNKLKNFCNILQVNTILGEHYNNLREKEDKIIDALCFKYIY
jgi:uncharacterized protein YacL